MGDCPHCPGALERHQATGLVVVCDCGAVHAPDGWRWPTAATATGTATSSPRTAPSAVPAPTAATATTRPAPEDPDEVRVRRLLCELRPDATGPLGWGPCDEVPSQEPARALPPVRVDGGGGRGGDVPAGAFLRRVGASAGTEAWERVQRLRVMAPEAGEALAYLQTRGTLARGLVTLLGELGATLATDTERRRWTTARQHVEGARVVGRARVALACAVWWGEEAVA